MVAFSSSRHEVEDIVAAQEFYHSRNWTDGLPIVPPTVKLLTEFLEWGLVSPEHILGREPVRKRIVTAEKVAINSIMAGCLAIHFPIVMAAITAMLKEPFLVHGATASTGGCAILTIVNGPIRKEVGMNATFNVLAASDRATTVIGRAIRLVLCNVLDVRPGQMDRSTLGHPGKFSYCFAEDEENSRWVSLAEDRGVPSETSAVTVMAAGAPRQVMNEWTTEPEEILDTFCAEIRANLLHYSIFSGNYVIVIPPQLRMHFVDSGWSKEDIKTYVFQKARVHRREWEKVGKGNIVGKRGDEEYAALPDAEHLLVIAAGGPAGGFGAVIPPWLGNKSKAVTVAVDACIDCN